MCLCKRTSESKTLGGRGARDQSHCGTSGKKRTKQNVSATTLRIIIKVIWRGGGGGKRKKKNCAHLVSALEQHDTALALLGHGVCDTVPERACVCMRKKQAQSGRGRKKKEREREGEGGGHRSDKQYHQPQVEANITNSAHNMKRYTHTPKKQTNKFTC